MHGLVSIIIPVYNSGDTLRRCVKSILNSDYENIEIIIIDDGSYKETADICDELKNQEKVQVYHQKNAGVSSARNTGIDFSKGEFITFVDADDSIERTLISTLVNSCVEKNSDIAICGYKEWYDNKHYTKYNLTDETEVLKNDMILKSFFLENKIGWNVWAKLYEKSVIGNTRFIEDKKNAEDMYFVYNVLKKTNKLVISGEALYNYIRTNFSAMSDPNCMKFFDTFELINKVYYDKTTNQSLETEKIQFYIKRQLWFFRFINAKDKKNKYRNEIEIARQLFLNNVKNIDNKINYSGKVKFELFLLHYLYPVFRLMSLKWAKYKKSL